MTVIGLMVIMTFPAQVSLDEDPAEQDPNRCTLFETKTVIGTRGHARAHTHIDRRRT